MTTAASPGGAFDAIEAAVGEQAAAAYEELFGPITDWLVAAILAATGVTAGSRLLDVACGPGHLAAQAPAPWRPTGRHRRRPLHAPTGARPSGSSA